MSQFWLTAEPNNPAPGYQNIGAGPDFWDFMTDPSEWSGIAGDLSVFQIYSDLLQTLSSEEWSSFFEWANEEDIPICFNSGVIPYDDPDIVSEVATFMADGGSLTYLSMDEPLWWASEMADSPHWTPQQVAANAAPALMQIIAMAPNVKIIDQEGIPITSAATLAAWCSAYALAMGRPLDGMQLDCDWNTGTASWEPALVAAVATLAVCGVPAEIIISAEQSTSMGWCDDAIRHYIICRGLFGTSIAAYSFQSWDPVPTDLLPDTSPGALANVEYAAQFYDQVNASYQSILGRDATQSELFSAMRALSTNILTIQQLQANLQDAGEGVTQSVLYDGDAGTATFLPGAVASVAITSGDQSVVAANSLTFIDCPIQDVNDNFVGYSTADTFVELSGAGTILAGTPAEYRYLAGPYFLGDLTNNVTFILDSDESITIGPSLGLSVVAAGDNDVVSMTWDASVGNTTSAGTSSPVLSGNATTVLDLACVGTVHPGNEISGVGTLDLSQAVAGNAFDYIASSDQNLLIADQSGGDIIELANATQTVVNDGTAAVVVMAAPSSAAATINGQDGEAILDVTTAGTFALGPDDADLIVRVPSFSDATLNGMSFITADATAGGAALTIGAAGETIWGGPADVVTDPSKLGFWLTGLSSNLIGDTFVDFNKSDAIQISDFVAPCTFVSVVTTENVTDVRLQQGLSALYLNFTGSLDAGAFSLSSDGAEGTILKCS